MKFSPSRAHRWVGGGCTASTISEELAPKRPPNAAADEGDRLHDLAADVLTHRRTPESVEPNDWELIGDYVDDVQATRAELGGNLGVEHWVRHRELTPGKIDASLLTATKLIIWDLKTGWRPVEARNNWQLLTSAMMLAPASGVEIELRIAQKPGYHPEGPIRSWKVPDLQPYMTRVRQAVHEAKTNPKLVATPSNCLYCRAVTNCPAARNVTLGGMDMALGATGAIPADGIRPELVALRTTEKLVKSKLAALEAEAEQRIRGGEAIPGCGLWAGKNGALSWAADDSKVRAVCAMAGVDATETKLRTPAQMIKAGVPEPLVQSISTRGSPKLSVSTDTSEQVRKLFS